MCARQFHLKQPGDRRPDEPCVNVDDLFSVQSVEWLAKRLHLGSRAYAHHLLWRVRKNESDNNKN